MILSLWFYSQKCVKLLSSNLSRNFEESDIAHLFEGGTTLKTHVEIKLLLPQSDSPFNVPLLAASYDLLISFEQYFFQLLKTEQSNFLINFLTKALTK